MNKRIKELAKQAETREIGYYFFDREKFAELLIQECVKVCVDRGTHHDGLYSAWADDCSKRIAIHFDIDISEEE